MVGHQVSAAFGAVPTLAERGLLERRDVLGARRDPTASGFHRLKAFTGPPDQERQELQWQ